MAELLNREHALAILYDLALTIGSEVTVAPLLIRTVQRLMYHTGFPVGIILVDEGKSVEGEWTIQRLQTAIGDYALARRQGEWLRLPTALCEGAAKAALAPDLLTSLGARKPRQAFLRLPVEGYGRILLLGERLPATDLPLTELFAPVMARLATTIKLCRSYEKEVQHRLERMAYYDALTELPNTLLFSDTVRQALIGVRRSNAWLAVVYLDIDDFKKVNTRFGQEMGDRLLYEVARRLERRLRPGEMAAHLMGDDFALLLPNLHGWESIEARVSDVLQLDQEPFPIAGQKVKISASVGVAVHPVDADDADSLMRHAQIAMHQAKDEARGKFRFFDAEHDRRASERRILVGQVENALAQGELRLYYQPKVDLFSGQTVGFEALLRWFDPLRGMVPPGDFLPVVEDSDLIVHIGEWVMREALRQVVAWRSDGLNTSVSVNIAGRHLQLPDFVERIRLALRDVPGATPDCLEIEILESTTLSDFAHVREVIEECRGMGVQFALDDFGTGYSSLAYLGQLPTTTVKIDQSFVRNMFERREDQTIIEAIVQIAEVFGRQVVAEGVESADHATLLMSMGCRIAQGFGIGRPMPAENIPDWVSAFRIPLDWFGWQDTNWHPSLYDLFRARHAHRVWYEELVGAVKRGDTLTVPVNPHECRLGQWLDRCRKLGYDHHVFQSLGETHDHLHSLIEILEVGLANQDNVAVQKVFGDFEMTSGKILTLIDEMICIESAKHPLKGKNSV